MTALARYERLEATGLYAESPEAAPREVVVAFGRASLTIMDADDTPLAHWPLAALSRIHAPGEPLTLAPDAGAAERLSIEDPEMAAAIRAVSAGLDDARRRRRRRQIRRVALAAAAALLLTAGALYMPRALESMAAAAPLTARAALGNAAIERFAAGRICDRPAARRALDRLGAKLGLAPGGLIAVDAPAPEGVPALAAAGGRIVLFRSTLRAASSPREVAEAVAAAIAGAERRPPAVAALSEAGLAGLIDAATGETESSALVVAAARLLREGRPAPDPAGGAALLAARGLDAGTVPLLPAESWAALRRACEP